MNQTIWAAVIVACAALTSNAALAKSEKSFHIGLPIVAMGGEAVTKGEWRLGKVGSLAVEWTAMSNVDLYSNAEKEENNNDSMMLSGNELSLAYTRYGNNKRMSGGYWSVGLGYRLVRVTWLRSPFEGVNQAAVSLNDEGKLTHTIDGAGLTARSKVGYRYVAESIPLSVGAYVGLRHYQNTMKDKLSATEVAVASSEEDRVGIERRLMSSLEPGIEVGLTF
jgi:hypothetical protein